MSDKKDYKTLIEEVKRIDYLAALYLETKARNLPDFIPSRHLDFCFHYKETPQGKEYWYNIENKLEELRKMENKQQSDYNDLINDVTKIDKEAAYFLKNDAKKLSSFSPNRYLDQCFSFEDTPQKSDYWNRIHQLILNNNGRCAHGMFYEQCGVCKEKSKNNKIKKDNSGIDLKTEVSVRKYLTRTKRNIVFIKDGIKYKVCYKCEKEKVMDDKNFIPSSIVIHGYENQCRECKKKHIISFLNEKRKEKQEKKKKESSIKENKTYNDNFKLPEEISTVAVEVYAPKKEEVSKERNIIISLDLTEMAIKYPEIFEELKIHAETRMRPIEYHAFWLIKIALDALPILINQ